MIHDKVGHLCKASRNKSTGDMSPAISAGTAYNNECFSALYLCKLPGALHSNTDQFTYTRKEIAEEFMCINLGLKNRA